MNNMKNDGFRPIGAGYPSMYVFLSLSTGRSILGTRPAAVAITLTPQQLQAPSASADRLTLIAEMHNYCYDCLMHDETHLIIYSGMGTCEPSQASLALSRGRGEIATSVQQTG